MAVTTGRAMDAAVATAMGDPHQLIRSTATLLADGTVARFEERQPLPYSTDDAVALAQCVPWLLGKGYFLDIHISAMGVVVVRATHTGSLVEFDYQAHALAHALCQVVLAVAGGGTS